MSDSEDVGSDGLQSGVPPLHDESKPKIMVDPAKPGPVIPTALKVNWKSPALATCAVTGEYVAPRQGSRKPRKRKARTVAKREIKKAQASTHNLTNKAPLEALIRDIASRFSSDKLCFEGNAIRALQTASEAHIIDIMAEAAGLAERAKRDTISPVDFDTARRIVK